MRHVVRITATLGFAVALLTSLTLLRAQAPTPPSAAPSKTPPNAAPAAKTAGKPDSKLSGPSQLRQGTELVDQLGQFKTVGDRVLFVMADGNRQLICLENLSLERVVRVLGANPEAGAWLVTGMVTEYRGSNYLLIHRVVLKSRGKP
jgi:hypothetical protein